MNAYIVWYRINLTDFIRYGFSSLLLEANNLLKKEQVHFLQVTLQVRKKIDQKRKEYLNSPVNLVNGCKINCQ